MTHGLPPDVHPPATFDDDESTSVVGAADVGGFFGGRFRIDNRLGVGAMGKVLSALDTQTGQLVALKVLHRDRSKDPDVLRRFGREARALSSIAHPAIVGIVASGRAPDGTPWLAMEHLVGTTLKDRIRLRGRMSVADLWPIMKTLAEAMAAAHAAGVVHRDLKPENVFLPERAPPVAKILDFGLSSLSRENERVTKTGEVLGTPRYMAPELLTSSKKPDHRVDVFALGVITFEALTGQSMYTADDLGSLFGQILEGRTRTLRELRPDLSETMEGLIQQATARDQDDRFGTVTAFVTAFGHAAGFHDAPAPPAPSVLASLFDDMTSTDAPHAPLLDPFSGVAIAPIASKKPSSIPVRSRAATAFGVAPVGVEPPGALARPHPHSAPPGAVRIPAGQRPSLKPANVAQFHDTNPDPRAGPASWAHGPTPSAPASRPRAMTPSPLAGPAAPPRGAAAPQVGPASFAAPSAPLPAITLMTPEGGGALSAMPALPPPSLGAGTAPAAMPRGFAATRAADPPAPEPVAVAPPPAPRPVFTPAPAGAAFSAPVPAPAAGRVAAPLPISPAPGRSATRPTWMFWALFGVAAVVVMALASLGALGLRWLIATGRL